jgi:hypothetical protein
MFVGWRAIVFSIFAVLVAALSSSANPRSALSRLSILGGD